MRRPVVAWLGAGWLAACGAPAGPAAVAAGLRELVGPRAWPAVRDGMAALLVLREHRVALALPRALLFR